MGTKVLHVNRAECNNCFQPADCTADINLEIGTQIPSRAARVELGSNWEASLILVLAFVHNPDLAPGFCVFGV
jgi:hypothetical protein